MKNLDYQTDDHELTEFFRQCKLRVVKIKILLNGQGQSKGVGMVEFQTPQEASYAVKELNGVDYNGAGRKLQIALATTSKQ